VVWVIVNALLQKLPIWVFQQAGTGQSADNTTIIGYAAPLLHILAYEAIRNGEREICELATFGGIDTQE